MTAVAPNLAVKLQAYGLKLYPQAEICGALRFRGPCRIFGGSVITNCTIGPFSYVNARSSVRNCTIGSYCSLSYDLDIGMLRHDLTKAATSSAFEDDDAFYRPYIHKLSRNPQDQLPAPVSLGHDVWIGSHVLIPASKPLKIGTGAVIASGAVITKDVPPFAVMGGSPARLIKLRFAEEVCQDLLDSAWWRFNLPLYMSEHPELPLEDPRAFAAAVMALRAELPLIKSREFVLRLTSPSTAALQPV